MKFRKILLAAVVALIVSFPAIASAKVVSVEWTCNSDGWEHVIFTYEDGTTREWITKECGPASPIAVGGGFNLLFSDNTRVSERGQTFLNAMETGEIMSPRRVPARDAEATRSSSRGMETIHLKTADVGPRLAAFLTHVDPDWNANPGTPSRTFSIFDRWGVMVAGVVLVPGDMALTIPIPTGEVGERRNAKQRCLDKHGIWREKPAGEWGCWTTAK